MLHFLSEDMRRDPFPFYDRVRETSPVVHVAEAGVWMIFDYEGVKRALNDHDAFSSNMPHSRSKPEPIEMRSGVCEAKLPCAVMMFVSVPSPTKLE